MHSRSKSTVTGPRTARLSPESTEGGRGIRDTSPSPPLSFFDFFRKGQEGPYRPTRSRTLTISETGPHGPTDSCDKLGLDRGPQVCYTGATSWGHGATSEKDRASPEGPRNGKHGNDSRRQHPDNHSRPIQEPWPKQIRKVDQNRHQRGQSQSPGHERNNRAKRLQKGLSCSPVASPGGNLRPTQEKEK